jgi:hypothetical protein
MWDLIFDCLSLIRAILIHLSDIAKNDYREIVIHEVAFLVTQQVHIFLRPHNSHIHIILSPLIEVEHKVCREVHRTTELVRKVYAVFATV